MPTIDIIIRNKTASAVDPPCIVCGNSDYNVKFDFDDEWQAHNNKIGVFAYNRYGEWRSENVLFEGDTCPVPALHGVRSVWIGVTAGDVQTSTPADVPCRMGATDFSDTNEPPSADVWGQILAKLDELQTEIDEIKAGGVGGTDISLGVTATVGQTIKVKAVDSGGKPTAWEAVDMAAGDTEVWEKVCQVTTTENVSFIYQPFGGYYKKIRAIFWGNPLLQVRCGYIQTRKHNRGGATWRIYLTHHMLTRENIRLLANLAHLHILHMTALITGIADDAQFPEIGDLNVFMPDGETAFLIITLPTPTLKISHKV